MDQRRQLIPKRIPLAMLPAGLVANVVRGVWIGMGGGRVWILPGVGPGWGLADGLIFSVCGVVLGFTCFLILWLLGVAGGGDVKLFAALSAWIGPFLSLVVMALSLALVMMMVIGQVGLRLLATGPTAAALASPRNARTPGVSGVRGTRISFALPLTVAAALVMLWSWRVDLFPGPAPASASAQVEAPRSSRIRRWGTPLFRPDTPAPGRAVAS